MPSYFLSMAAASCRKHSVACAQFTGACTSCVATFHLSLWRRSQISLKVSRFVVSWRPALVLSTGVRTGVITSGNQFLATAYVIAEPQYLPSELPEVFSEDAITSVISRAVCIIDKPLVAKDGMLLRAVTGGPFHN